MGSPELGMELGIEQIAALKVRLRCWRQNVLAHLDGWSEEIDTESGHAYYYNHITGYYSWDPPFGGGDGAESASSAGHADMQAGTQTTQLPSSATRTGAPTTGSRSIQRKNMPFLPVTRPRFRALTSPCPPQ